MLSAQTQAAIDTAIASRDGAAKADNDDAVAVQAMQAATATEAAAKAASIAAHQVALKDAHAAVDALVAELAGPAPATLPPPAAA